VEGQVLFGDRSTVAILDPPSGGIVARSCDLISRETEQFHRARIGVGDLSFPAHNDDARGAGLGDTGDQIALVIDSFWRVLGHG
jgi:hypothetical protein